MILAIDTGNTHIVLGCIDEQGEISHILRLESNLKKTEYEYASDIKQILELENVDRFGFSDAIISSSVPQLIIDMGTATTVTVVDAKGRYIGGAIMPGVRLSMHALADGTSLLPNIEITPPQKTIASNTIDCMKSGIIYGSAGALDGILDHYIDELGGSVGSVVATGGLASTICPMCRHAITLDSNLLLKGLYVIYQKNKAKKHRK